MFKSGKPKLFTKPSLSSVAAKKPSLKANNTNQPLVTPSSKIGTSTRAGDNPVEPSQQPVMVRQPTDPTSSNLVSSSDIRLKRADDEVPTGFEEVHDIIIEEPIGLGDDEARVSESPHRQRGPFWNKTNSVMPVTR